MPPPVDSDDEVLPIALPDPVVPILDGLNRLRIGIVCHGKNLLEEIIRLDSECSNFEKK